MKRLLPELWNYKRSSVLNFDRIRSWIAIDIPRRFAVLTLSSPLNHSKRCMISVRHLSFLSHDPRNWSISRWRSGSARERRQRLGSCNLVSLNMQQLFPVRSPGTFHDRSAGRFESYLETGPWVVKPPSVNFPRGNWRSGLNVTLSPRVLLNMQCTTISVRLDAWTRGGRTRSFVLGVSRTRGISYLEIFRREHDQLAGTGSRHVDWCEFVTGSCSTCSFLDPSLVSEIPLDSCSRERRFIARPVLYARIWNLWIFGIMGYGRICRCDRTLLCVCKVNCQVEIESLVVF